MKSVIIIANIRGKDNYRNISIQKYFRSFCNAYVIYISKQQQYYIIAYVTLLVQEPLQAGPGMMCRDHYS